MATTVDDVLRTRVFRGDSPQTLVTVAVDDLRSLLLTDAECRDVDLWPVLALEAVRLLAERFDIHATDSWPKLVGLTVDPLVFRLPRPECLPAIKPGATVAIFE